MFIVKVMLKIPSLIFFSFFRHPSLCIKSLFLKFLVFRAKEEALRIKKKIESDINELEIALDHANKANAETAKTIKRAATNLLEVETSINEESKARADIQDQAATAERKG